MAVGVSVGDGVAVIVGVGEGDGVTVIVIVDEGDGVIVIVGEAVFVIVDEGGGVSVLLATGSEGAVGLGAGVVGARAVRDGAGVATMSVAVAVAGRDALGAGVDAGCRITRKNKAINNAPPPNATSQISARRPPR